ncbi:MAG: zinc ribbon domain-containing protein [Candidatus Omnitrophota bacterium]
MAEYICPQCKQPIYDDDALLCLYCGGSLGRGSAGFASGTPKIMMAIIGLIVLLSFLMLIIR